LADATETKQVSITLPITWVDAIDSQTTEIKTRQDIIREWLEPKVKKIMEVQK
jgi:hypothetical protein